MLYVLYLPSVNVLFRIPTVSPDCCVKYEYDDSATDPLAGADVTADV